MIKAIKGDTRSLDYDYNGSCPRLGGTKGISEDRYTLKPTDC